MPRLVFAIGGFGTMTWGDALRQDRASAMPGREVTLADLIVILWRRAAIVVAVAAAIIVPALIYALLAPKTYTATSTVMVEPRAGLSQSPDVRAPFSVDAALVESQVRLITSDPVLRRVVERERLFEDADFVKSGPGLIGGMMRLAGLGKAETPADLRTAAALALAQAITVRRPERTYIIEISVETSDAKKAARIANAVADSYIIDQNDNRVDIAKRDGETIKARLDELRQRMTQAENEVEAYKAANNIVGASGKLINEQQLSELTNSLIETRAKLAEAKAKDDLVRRILATGRGVDSLPDALKSSTVERLRQQYAEIARQGATYRQTLGPRHPQLAEVERQARDTKGLIEEELGRIAQATRNDVVVARNNEAVLLREVEGLKRDSTSTNATLVRLRELEREVEANRGLYDNFLRARGVLARETVDSPVARIIAPALPPVGPSSPRRVAIMLLAVGAGLGLGIAAAFVREHLAVSGRLSVSGRLADQTAAAALPGRAIKAASFAGRDFVMPAPPVPDQEMIAANPFGPQADPRLGLVSAKPEADYAQAALGLAQALSTAAQTDRPLTILLCGVQGASGASRSSTSSRLSDKTILAANLAQAFAELGAAVLIVDADRPAMGLSRALPAKARLGMIDMDGAGQPRLLAQLAHARGVQTALVPATPRAWQSGDCDGFQGLSRVSLHDFDVMIVDGPARISDGTAAHVATRPDHVLLVAGQAEHDKSELAAWLERLRPEHGESHLIMLQGSAQMVAA
jgi:polysaccharide biosynthesis transport protein